jgi:hypothetical protein
MPKFFEQIGAWLDVNKDKKPERSPQECVEYLADSIAIVKADTPNELKQQARALAALKGFTEALPWREMKGQLFCRQSEFANLAKAQEVGDGSMSFKRSLIDERLVSQLENYCDGFVFDKPLDALPDARSQPFIVLVRNEERKGE